MVTFWLFKAVDGLWEVWLFYIIAGYPGLSLYLWIVLNSGIVSKIDWVLIAKDDNIWQPSRGYQENWNIFTCYVPAAYDHSVLG